MDLSQFGDALAERRARLKYEIDDERRRKRQEQLVEPARSGSGGGGGGYSGGRIVQPRHAAALAPTRVGRSTAVRYAGIARGSQSAVVKLASYGGGAGAGAMIAYVSREGSLRMENERGETLERPGDVARVLSEWAPLMDNRAFSKDIASFSMRIEGDFAGLDDAQLRDIGRSTLHGLLASRTEDGEDGHSFAVGVERQDEGAATLTGLMVLRSREGHRRTPDAKGEGMLARRIAETKGELAAEAGSFRFTGFGNGVEYGTFQMRELVARFDGQITTDRGQAVADRKRAGDVVQRHWRSELHSRAPRDVMHLIMSAKAGTDAPAFAAAVRGFLAEQFAEQGHRYVFAMHDPASDPKAVEDGGQRPHVHVHAIITMRSDYGDRARISPATFRAWRESLAEQARGHGINMEMTDRRDVASAPAYTRNQVRPVSRQGRTEHEGTSRPAHARYLAKREGTRVYARSARSVQYGAVAARTWGALALSADTQIARFATAQIEQIRVVEAGGAQVVHLDERREASPVFIQNMVYLQAFISEEAGMADGEQREIQTRPEFELYEKSVNAAIFRAERDVTDAQERAALDDFTNAVREVVEARRDLVETAAALNEHDVLRKQGVDVDAAYKRYDAAVGKHGEHAVDSGTPLLENLNRAREAWLEAGRPEDLAHPAAAIYDSEIASVIQGARNGNRYLNEIVQGNELLRTAAEEILAAERGQEIDERKSDSAGTVEGDSSQAAPDNDPSATGGGGQEAASLEYESDGRQRTRDENQTRALHEQQLRVDANAKIADRGRNDQSVARDRPNADPAGQQVSRQDEQYRQQRERDDDDRDQ